MMRLRNLILFSLMSASVFAEGVDPSALTTATVPVTTTAASAPAAADPHIYLYFTSNVLGEIDPCG